MVADSITDSELFHGSPISRDSSKNDTQWKIDAFRKQLIYQYDEEISQRLKKLTDTKSWRKDYEEGNNGFTKFNDEFDLASSPTSVLKREGSVNEDCICCSKPLPEKEEEDVFEDAYDNWDSFEEALNPSDNDKDENLQVEKEDSEEEEEEPNMYTSQEMRMPTPRKLLDDKNVKPPETSSEETTERRSEKMKKSESKSEKQDVECPICFEVMDATDLAFKPCPCGFQVCLFCHKTITEDEGRCPSCRREYDKKSDDDTGERFQLPGRGPITLSPSFNGLDRA